MAEATAVYSSLLVDGDWDDLHRVVRNWPKHRDALGLDENYYFRYDKITKLHMTFIYLGPRLWDVFPTNDDCRTLIQDEYQTHLEKQAGDWQLTFKNVEIRKKKVIVNFKVPKEIEDLRARMLQRIKQEGVDIPEYDRPWEPHVSVGTIRWGSEEDAPMVPYPTTKVLELPERLLPRRIFRLRDLQMKGGEGKGSGSGTKGKGSNSQLSHDIDQGPMVARGKGSSRIACSFHMKGQCSKGLSCRFSHDINQYPTMGKGMGEGYMGGIGVQQQMAGQFDD